MSLKVGASQILLFPDPRPLVERLGPEFFRTAPECPGVYLMRDATDAVLYVGKAKNLRKRLGSYRVANPDRLARRHLRLLRAVVRIELRQCADEASALAAEAELLRNLRPRFNRAGTWTGARRFLLCRAGPEGVELAVRPADEPGWASHGPLGAGARLLREVIARLLWSALHPQRGVAGMPQGWFGGLRAEVATIPRYLNAASDLAEAQASVERLFQGDAEGFAEWILRRTAGQKIGFELRCRDNDLETIRDWVRPTESKAPPAELLPP